MKRIFENTICKELDNNTIKNIMICHYGMSTRLINNIKKKGNILLNGVSVFVNIKVKIGDHLKIIFPDEYSINIVPTSMLLDIIYEDEDIMVINKPSNINVHPCQNNYNNTLANGVVYYWNQKNEKHVFRPVNRLDKDTSGLILIAKNQYAHHKFSLQMKEKEFKRRYIGIIQGHLDNSFGTINLPIKRKEGSIIERCISPDGVEAITDYRVLKNIDDKQVIEFQLKTGRTHQIRVHMSYLGTPLIGDGLYGKRSDDIKRHALHSYLLTLNHPYTKKKLTFYSKLPNDMMNIILNNG